MIAGLPGFRGESRLRTWLYRIAVNHIFTFRKQRQDEPVDTYEDFDRDLEQTPDLDPRDPGATSTTSWGIGAGSSTRRTRAVAGERCAASSERDT